MIEEFNLNNISGLVFDCDGTLLDTLDVWRAAEEDLFAQIPFELSPEQEDAIHSVSVEQAARIFHETYGVGESTQAVFDHLESRLLAFYATDAKPLPGAVALVRAAREHSIPCVVVSSSPRRYLEAGLAAAGIADCFERLISTEDAGVSKQDPKIYQLALETLGSDIKTTWALDDAPYACRAMSAFGFKTIAPVNGEGAERQAEKAKAATLTVETLEELL